MNSTAISFALNLLLSSSLISFSAWLAGKKPSLAGFILALPLSSMIALALSHVQWADTERTVIYAKSIFISIPLSLTFFLPFLFAKQLKFPFWGLYTLGICLLGVSYLIHLRFFADQG